MLEKGLILLKREEKLLHNSNSHNKIYNNHPLNLAYLWDLEVNKTNQELAIMQRKVHVLQLDPRLDAEIQMQHMLLHLLQMNQLQLWNLLNMEALEAALSLREDHFSKVQVNSRSPFLTYLNQSFR